MIRSLEGLDVRLSADGEHLRINAPKGALSAELRDQIAGLKHEILTYLRRAADKPGVHSAIPRIAEDEPAPLSFAQERLWLVEQLQPESAVFNLCRAARITGRLNLPALEWSLSEIQRRHESLRSQFVTIDASPRQVVIEAAGTPLIAADLRGVAKAKRESEAARLLHEEARRPFDLTQGRLLRARLLRLDDDRYILALVTHHLAADAWSMGILTRDLWALYQSRCAGKAFPLPETTCRYRDYAAWQRRRFDELAPAELDYWKAQLAGVPVLDLPSDRPRPVTPTFHGARVTFEVGEAMTQALHALSERGGATLFMTLLAAFQILLGRWTGQDDIVVGAPLADRERPEIEGIIGLFVSTLALRTDLSGSPSFRDLLGRVRKVCLGAYEHQSVPFESLVRELRPQRQRHPLFQVMFVLQNTPRHPVAPPGLTVEPLEIDSASAQFDLSLYLREREGRLIGYLEYPTDLFEHGTVKRMAGHFQTLLQGIVANPDCSIANLSLLSDREQRQLLIEWNDTAAPYPKRSCIHELFEAQAGRTPDAVALECGDKKITYRELNGRANRLARKLQRFGVGPERFVAVLADRSLETIIGILAILKAGGAYVPLDPQYPIARLRFMLADAGAGVLLTQRKFAGYFPAYSGATILVDDLLRGAAGTAANLRSATYGESAACVIYTSGSTGKPKGIAAPHRGALNRFSWMWKAYPFGAGEKSCQKTSLSFVDSVWEIFGALLKGVPTVIIPDAIAKEPRLLVKHLAERRVTRLVLVPSLLSELLERCADLPHRLARLQYCFCSGEALSRDVAERLQGMLPACRLINLYGSSEVAGDVTWHEVGAAEEDSRIPIGRPIDNTQAYLLDQYLQPVPIGARGELYVGGDNLARGYLYRPELTAEKFIPNPFSTESGSRLYRTGDLARYRPDGTLEFLGRSDGQVKIRGHRIELGEVEAALRGHPGVRECLVNVHRLELKSDNPKSKIKNQKYTDFVIAYVVGKNGRLSAAELREFLKARLPDPMLPSRFVFLEDIPLLPNGKVDRGALALLGATERQRELSIDEPRTEIETLVAEVWRQVLKIEAVGVVDNFFALGGHSLMAAEVAAKLRDVFGRPVAAADLFDCPTVAGLAKAIEKRLQGKVEDDLPAILPARHKQPERLSLGQEPLFVFGQLFGGGDFLNMPYAYRLDGPLDVSALRRAIQEIVKRHAALRTAFLDTDAGPRPWVHRSAAITLPLVDLARLPEQETQIELEQISKRDAARPFDLEKTPLMRVKLLRLAQARHVLLVTAHHIISDQWSMSVFRKELAAFYEAFCKGVSSPLAPLPIQFGDFAAWQRRMLQKGFFQGQISYWRKQLGAPPAPLDFRRGATKRGKARFHSSRRPIEIDDRLFASIKAFAREQNCTPFMIFIAALSILLHRHTGKTDIRIGTLIANRGQPGTDLLIGYFVNALILRVRLRPTMTFNDVIRQVRTTAAAAYAHQDLPFEYLEALLEHKHGKQKPLYQVMLNYRNQRASAIDANGVTIASWNGKQRAADPGIAISRLDLNFHLRELSTGLTGAVNYRTDLFDDAAIAKFLADYSKTLEQIVERSAARVGASRMNSRWK